MPRRNSIHDDVVSVWTERLYRLEMIAQMRSLDHKTRNQLNALTLASQVLLRRAQLGLGIDSQLLNLAMEHWLWFEDAFFQNLEDKKTA